MLCGSMCTRAPGKELPNLPRRLFVTNKLSNLSYKLRGPYAEKLIGALLIK